jgi:hypothetical protein
MCYYITATMAPNGDESAVRRLAKASLLKWEPLDNPGVVKQLHPGERYFLTTRGMCDCGTEIGVSLRSDGRLPDRDPDLSREIKRLKKKGWTENKIDRWIEQTKADAARKHAESEARLSGPHPEVDRWIQFVSEVLAGKHADWVGILVHWYGGNVTTEAIVVGNRRWLALHDFTEDYLLNAEENTLHTVTLQTRFMPK